MHVGVNLQLASHLLELGCSSTLKWLTGMKDIVCSIGNILVARDIILVALLSVL
jgi:hypothetical protein